MICFKCIIVNMCIKMVVVLVIILITTAAAAAVLIILAQKTTCLKAFLGSQFRQPITFMS